MEGKRYVEHKYHRYYQNFFFVFVFFGGGCLLTLALLPAQWETLSHWWSVKCHPVHFSTSTRALTTARACTGKFKCPGSDFELVHAPSTQCVIKILYRAAEHIISYIWGWELLYLKDFFLIYLTLFYMHWPWNVSNPPELELETAVSCHVNAGNWTQVLWKSSQWS